MFDLTLVAGAGLDGLGERVVNDWLGPLFLVAIAITGVVLAFKKQFRQAAVAAAVFVIAGIFIYFAGDFFGESGSLTGAGKSLANEVQQYIMLPFIK